jgi:hypothetical protein
MRKHILLAHDALFVGSYLAVGISYAAYFVGHNAAHEAGLEYWYAYTKAFERVIFTYSAIMVGMTLSAVTVRGLIDQPRIYARLPPPPPPPPGKQCIYP